MSRPLSSAPRKSVQIDPKLVRAYQRAKLDADERGEPFPATLSKFLEEAARDWLSRNQPEALKTPGPGRPRKK